MKRTRTSQPKDVPERYSDTIRERLEERIVAGTYPPGMKLDEVALATEFGVSRTPIRETLIQLSASGMIELRPHRGAVVMMIDALRLSEMFEVMAELEGLCSRLAARRISDEGRAELLAVHRACGKVSGMTDTDEYFHLNEQFHQCIYRASGSVFLADQAAMLQRRLRPYRRLQLRTKNRTQASFSEHQAIVNAILAGDEQQAGALLRNHVIVQGDRYRDLIASMNSLQPRPPVPPRRRPSADARGLSRRPKRKAKPRVARS